LSRTDYYKVRNLAKDIINEHMNREDLNVEEENHEVWQLESNKYAKDFVYKSNYLR